jgi:threonine/homoserine/homoserine lactone efflux protein
VPIHLFLQGVIMGFVVAVPVGPLGLLCINRALSMGPLSGLYSGFGVATADALAAGIAALGLTLVSEFLIDHQTLLRIAGGLALCYLGVKIYRTEPRTARTVAPVNDVNSLASAYATTFVLTLSNPVTVLSFFAIYAGWGVESLSGYYSGAAMLTAGVFVGSALWWLILACGLVLFHDRFSHHLLGWIHKVSGVVIAGFGIVVFLSLWKASFGAGP